VISSFGYLGKRRTLPSLDDLGARLTKARDRRGRPGKIAKGAGTGGLSGLGMAFRMGVELVAAIVVGVGIGLLLDKALGTTPWMLVVFLFLGMGAGILNVYRATTGMGLAVGYPKQDDGDDGKDDGGEDDGKDRRNGPSEQGNGVGGQSNGPAPPV
jgi:ATP synthase protein I